MGLAESRPSEMATSTAKRFETHALGHLDAVFRMARRLARDESEADDLVQETYLRAYRSFDQFELREYGAKPWLLKILHNTFYTRRGKARKQPTLLDDVDFDHFSAELESAATDETGLENIAWDQIDEELKQAVQELQPEYRMVLLLWAFEEMSYREIAEVCECAVGTVMSRLFRGRQLVMQKLGDYVVQQNIRTKA